MHINYEKWAVTRAYFVSREKTRNEIVAAFVSIPTYAVCITHVRRTVHNRANLYSFLCMTIKHYVVNYNWMTNARTRYWERHRRKIMTITWNQEEHTHSDSGLNKLIHQSWTQCAKVQLKLSYGLFQQRSNLKNENTVAYLVIVFMLLCTGVTIEKDKNAMAGASCAKSTKQGYLDSEAILKQIHICHDMCVYNSRHMIST